MHKNIHTFLKELRNQTFDEHVKRDIRHAISLFADAHPVKTKTSYIPSPFFNHMHMMRHVPTMLVAIIMIGGVTAYAAEYAVPGDLLYPVKLSVNETVRSTLAISDKSQAEWDTQIAERRVEEALILAVKGNITEEHKEKLTKDFEDHANKANTLISKLEANGNEKAALEVRSEFEARLRAKQDVLINVAVIQDEARETTGSITASLRDQLTQNFDTRVMMMADTHEEEGRVNTQEISQAKKKSTQQIINETKKYVEAHKSKVTDDVYNRARVRIKAAQEIFNEADLLYGNGEYSKSFNKFTEAHGLAQEAHIFIDTALKVTVNVSGDDELYDDVEQNKSSVDPVTESVYPQYKIEAHVFTDTTVIEFTHNDVFDVLEIDVIDREDIIEKVSKTYDLIPADVEQVIVIISEDRPSKVQDSKN